MIKQILIGTGILGVLTFSACDNFNSTSDKPLTHKEVKSYFEDSIPKVIWEYPQGDSSLIEVSYFYHNQALKMKGFMEGGVRKGKWIAYDEEGNMLSQGHYKDGFEDGMYTVWYPSGVKRYEGIFKSGKRLGIWSFWDAEGNLVKEIEY